MKTYSIKVGNIGTLVVEAEKGGGNIVSGLMREVCFVCKGADCSDPGHEHAYQQEGRHKYNGGLDALESFVLALACAGQLSAINLDKVGEAMLTTLDAMGNNCDLDLPDDYEEE